MVGLERLELSTPRLSSVCSNQLSYRPGVPFEKHLRFFRDRPATFIALLVRGWFLTKNRLCVNGYFECCFEKRAKKISKVRGENFNSILLFLVPATSENAGDEYRTLLRELELYDPTLLDKERLLAISKMDLIDEESKADLIKTLPTDIPHVFISSIIQEGISELKDLIWKTLNP